MTRTKLAGLLLIGLAALTACAGTPPSGAQPTAPTTTSAAAESPSPEPEPMDAEAVAKALIDAGVPAKVTVVYTEENDPNKQMGRPHGYTSKVAFRDSRINRTEVLDRDRGSIEMGGGVEVFADNADAQARADYIEDVTAGNQMLTEYTYVAGPVVLRLSKHLVPKHARAYEAALQEVVR